MHIHGTRAPLLHAHLTLPGCHAGLYFAGERIEVPDLFEDDSQPSDSASGAGGAPAAAAAAAGSALPGASAEGAAADAGSAGTTASGGTRPAQGAYGASVPRVSLGDALTHVEDGSGVLLAVDDRGTACASARPTPVCSVSALHFGAAPLCLLAPALHTPGFTALCNGSACI